MQRPRDVDLAGRMGSNEHVPAHWSVPPNVVVYAVPGRLHTRDGSATFHCVKYRLRLTDKRFVLKCMMRGEFNATYTLDHLGPSRAAGAGHLDKET